MINYMNEFTYFPKKERISWILLALFITAGICLPKYLFPEEKINAKINFSKTCIDSAIATVAEEKIPSPEKVRKHNSEFQSQNQDPEFILKQPVKVSDQREKKRFLFDPNKTPDDSIRMIFSRYIAQNLIKYRNKGGHFKDKQDLLRIYGMDTILFRKIEPFIRIQSARINRSNRMEARSFPDPVPEKTNRSIAINDADTTLFKSLPGIGSVFARRIIAFRDALGGFYNVDQVAETYGLPTETFRNIRDRLTIGKQHNRIRVNSASRKDLAAHPYISWKQARAISLYREAHGPFADRRDLRDIKALDSAFFEKIIPYLDFEPVHGMTADSISSSRGGR